ncbi:MAG: acyl-CoA dehydrogenase [Pseudonocardiaceae bacterium]|nr:acyl-CoA dehydrogenase [Pseudonocardiaceae bacterium]
MDFALTEAQHDLAELTRRIVTDRVTAERLREIDAEPDHFDRPLWTELARSGVLGAGLPAALGGAGYGLLEECAVLIEIGRALAPVPFLPAIVQAGSSFARFGTAEQRERWGSATATGELIATAALAEEDTDHPRAPVTRAKRADGGWRLTGAKTTVPAGGIAELVVVPAQTPDGLTVFLVSPEDPGVSLRRQVVVDSDSEACLEFDGAWVGSDRVLGEVGQGEPVVGWLLERGTVGLCAHQLGVAERALEMTAEYARTRVQFDRAIGTFQAVSQRLADAYVDVEAIRLTLWQAAWMVSEGMDADLEVSTAKFWAADAGHRVAHTAVHVHGGVGIDIDYPLHRYFVAAKRNEFSLGAATAQLRGVGNVLATEPA